MTLLMRQMLYQLSYRGNSADWAESRQYKARATGLTSPDKQTESTLKGW